MEETAVTYDAVSQFLQSEMIPGAHRWYQYQEKDNIVFLRIRVSIVSPVTMLAELGMATDGNKIRNKEKRKLKLAFSMEVLARERAESDHKRYILVDGSTDSLIFYLQRTR